MTATVVKGKLLSEDFAAYDGRGPLASRKDSTGGTIAGLKVGTEVDVLLVYGNSVSYTRGTIDDCIRSIGSASATLVFRPGTWTIDADLTIASNFTCRIPAGAVFNVSSGKTLTFSGPVIRDSNTWTSGSGTVTESGTRAFSGAETHSGTETHSGATESHSGAVTHTGTVTWSKGAAVASAAALTPGTDGNFFHVTGAITITSIAAAAPSPLKLVFDGALILTYNATTLILPGAANITTAAGDTAEFFQDGAGNWRCTNYVKANGTPVVSVTVLGFIAARKTVDESVTLSATLQDDDHLTFAIAASEEWVADFYLDIGNLLQLTGVKLAITVPALATLNVVADAISGEATNYPTTLRTTTSGGNLNFVTAFFVGVASGVFRLSVWVLNSTNAGSVTMQFAQSTSNATAVTVRKGSHLLASRVA